MKKFFIFIFAMFGLMVGFVAIVLSGYYRDYEKFHNRSSFPEPKENLLVPVKKEQAVLRAKSYQKFHYSKEKLVGQLVDVDLFTPEEADYAIEKVHFDWKEEAVKEAESSANGGNISKERLLEILVENRKFTQEEAEYAIEHAQVDWLN